MTLIKCHNFVSAASDIDPDNVAGQKTAEPAIVVEEQTGQEQFEEQPMVVTAAESAEGHPAPARTGASTPARDDEAARTPPRAVSRRRKTELRLPRLLKKGGSQLHLE